MMRFIFICFFYLLSAPSYSQISQNDFSIKQPDSIQKLKKLSLWATQYFIHQFESSGEIPLIDEKGKHLGLYADTCNFCEARLEGTAYVKDSLGKITIINFVKNGSKSYINCRSCKKYSNSKLDVDSWGKALWTITDGFGNGVKNFKLIPFRTIAVDSKIIPYGTVIYIPAIKGKLIELPNGKKVIHDGYFIAGDTGSAITKNHIDIFTGIYQSNPFPEVIKSKETDTFEAYIINNSGIVNTLNDCLTK